MGNGGTRIRSSCPTPLRFAAGSAVVVTIVFRARSCVSTPLIDEGSLFLLLSTAVMATAWRCRDQVQRCAATGAGGALFAGGWSTEANAAATYARLALFLLPGPAFSRQSFPRCRRAGARCRRGRTPGRRVAPRGRSRQTGSKTSSSATISHELRYAVQRRARMGARCCVQWQARCHDVRPRGLESIERNVAPPGSRSPANLLDVSKAHHRTSCASSADPCRSTTARAKRRRSALPAAHAKGVHIVTRSSGHDRSSLLATRIGYARSSWQSARQRHQVHPSGRVVSHSPSGAAHDQAHPGRVVTRGPGIDPVFLPQIFERFAQQDASPTRTAGGLGVGLSLVGRSWSCTGASISAANLHRRTRRRSSSATFRCSLPHICTTSRPSIAGRRLGYSGARRRPRAGAR